MDSPFAKIVSSYLIAVTKKERFSRTFCIYLALSPASNSAHQNDVHTITQLNLSIWAASLPMNEPSR